MSITRCDSCDNRIDTDDHPEAYIADGEVCLCGVCLDYPEVTMAALELALAKLKAYDLHRLRTDNAYANSGRMSITARRMSAIDNEMRYLRENGEVQ